MRTNSNMRALLSEGPIPASYPRDQDDLRDIVNAGWTVGPHGALLLAACWSDGWSRDTDPEALGRFEYEVNEVNIKLQDLAGDMSSYLPKAAERGLAFAKYMLEAASTLPDSNRLSAVLSVSVDTDDKDFLIQGAVVRFFTNRGHYPDWYEDLDRFRSEAIAVLHRGDAVNCAH